MSKKELPKRLSWGDAVRIIRNQAGYSKEDIERVKAYMRRKMKERNFQSKGGKARAKKLGPERVREIAKKASDAAAKVAKEKRALKAGIWEAAKEAARKVDEQYDEARAKRRSAS